MLDWLCEDLSSWALVEAAGDETTESNRPGPRPTRKFAQVAPLAPRSRPTGCSLLAGTDSRLKLSRSLCSNEPSELEPDPLHAALTARP